MFSLIPYMKPSLSSTSACRHCRYYQPEGRRGGQCQQLNVTVQSGWKACSLAIPPFAPAWENLEEIMIWQQKALAAQAEVVDEQVAPVDVPTAAPLASEPPPAVRQRLSTVWL